MIRYSAQHALNGGKGATKQMMYNCAMWFRVEEGMKAPSWKWFKNWLNRTPELHTIRTKPIASHRVDIHTEHVLRQWFEEKYRLALLATGIRHRKNVHNIDEKGARVCMLAREEVVVPIGITKMYTSIPENRLSVTVIECISADGRAIPPVIIIPGTYIIASWFDENTKARAIEIRLFFKRKSSKCLTFTINHTIRHY